MHQLQVHLTIDVVDVLPYNALTLATHPNLSHNEKYNSDKSGAP